MEAFRDSGITNPCYDLHRYADVGRLGLLRHCVLILLPPNVNPWWRLKHSSVLLVPTSSESIENDLHEEADIFALVY